MKVIRLENTVGVHFKFYELWAGAYVNNATDKADKAFAGTRWGRIGTQGQTSLIEFEGEHCKADAYSFVQKKIREKQAGGYKLVPETTHKDEPGVVGIDHEPAASAAQMTMLE